MSRHSKHFYEFDDFRLDVTERLLFRDGEMISLTQKAFELLLALVENNNRIVEKGELMLKVWPDSFVEEGNLTQNIYQLRKALGQATDRDGYIKTIPRRGYRFAADVREWREDPQPFKPPTWAAAPGVTGNNPSEKAVEAAADGAGNDRPVWPSPHGVSDDRPKGRAGRLLALTAGLILLAGGVFFLATSGKRPSTADGDSASRQMSVIALTSAGNVSCAAISPDGRLIAYATIDKPQQSSLWVEQLDTASRQAILPPGGRRYHALTFTPDGRYLYYIAITDDEPIRTLYRVPTLGGPTQKILGDVQTAVSFSPDGTQFVFRRALDERRESVLFIARADGGGEREIAAVKYPESFSDPSWSPDGQTIAAATGNLHAVAGMYVSGISATNWSMRRMTALNWRWIGQMAWLADSSRLVMVAKDRAASPNQVWLLSSADGTARQLSNDANDYNRLSLAASGRVMAALQTKQVSNVWMIQGDGSERARQVTFGTGGYRGGISWAPDGNLVYESEAGGAPALSVMGADGGGARLLSNDGAQQNESVGNPVATPDGRYILYTSDRNGERHIWRMNADGSNPVQLTNGSGEDYPHAAPDGEWVVYTNLERNNSEKPTLGKVSINGGELTKLTDEFTGYAAISPDGKTIACLYSQGPGTPFQIALYSSAGGPPQKIFPQPISAQFIRWKRDGSGITYAENGLAGGAKIWVQPLDGERPRQLIEFENDRVFGLDWSPGGDRLVVVRGSWTGNVVIFKNLFGD